VALFSDSSHYHKRKEEITYNGECVGYYKIRRVLKAAHAFSKKEKAQFAVVIEVFSGA
jgi:hypothetical protein